MRRISGWQRAHPTDRLLARNSPSYQEWLRQVEQCQPPALATSPLISVVMPTYNTDLKMLERAVRSVVAQSYAAWEFCIVDDASSHPELRAQLEELARSDRRIKLKFRSTNGHIARATNDAIAMASGDYVAFLDHDDELAPSALAEVAQAIARSPEAIFFYSDEDQIDHYGRHFEPFFKPDFSPDLLLGLNYVCHLLVARRTTVQEVGGMRAGFEGAQDFDLVLRLAEKGPAKHIPKVLYHWRSHELSTALNPAAKNYAHEAGLAALRDAVQRRKLEAEAVSGRSAFTYRIRYRLPAKAPLVSIIIPFRDKAELLRACLESILARTTYVNYELVLVDNQSRETETRDLLDSYREDRRFRLLAYDHAFNFAAINNIAALTAQGEHLLFLNNDTSVISAHWLEDMLELSCRPEVGVVGAALFYPDRTLQHAGVVIGMSGLAGHAFASLKPREVPQKLTRFTRNVSAVTAACMMTRREVFEKLRGMDERFVVCGNDVDYCLRAQQAGYRVLFTPNARLFHYESKTRDPHAIPPGDFAESVRAYSPLIRRGDPFYNPNLSRLDQSFALKRPGEEEKLRQLVRSLPGGAAYE